MNAPAPVARKPGQGLAGVAIHREDDTLERDFRVERQVFDWFGCVIHIDQQRNGCGRITRRQTLTGDFDAIVKQTRK